MSSSCTHKTIPEQLIIADGIYRRVTSSGIPVQDQEARLELLKDLSSEYKDFCVSHPVILRYMCQMDAYNSGAFEGYLKAIAENPGAIFKVKGFLSAQADYVARLTSALTPGGLTSEGYEKIKTEVSKVLNKEYDDLQDKYAEARKQVDLKKETNALTVRKEFKKAISAGISGAGTVRVECAIPDVKVQSRAPLSEHGCPSFTGAEAFL